VACSLKLLNDAMPRDAIARQLGLAVVHFNTSHTKKGRVTNSKPSTPRYKRGVGRSFKLLAASFKRRVAG